MKLEDKNGDTFYIEDLKDWCKFFNKYFEYPSIVMYQFKSWLEEYLDNDSELQKLYSEIEDLEEDISHLESEVTYLEQENDELRKRLAHYEDNDDRI